MNEGAIAEVIENHPIANANVPRSRTRKAKRQAGTERTGQRRRNGVRARTRSETRTRMIAAMPAAREKRAKSKPSSRDALVKRNEPRGVAAETRPSTPPWPANARDVRRPIRRKFTE